MKNLGFGIRFLVAAVFIALCGFLLFLGYQSYQREARPEPDLAQSGGRNGVGQTLVEELDQALEKPQAQPGRYRIIEDKNLFSPQREAWKDETVVEAAPEEVPLEAKPQRKDVKLYGLFAMKDKKFAIVGLPRIPLRNKRHVMNEGETVANNDPDRFLSYTLLSIREDSVLMKDQAGERFLIRLETSDAPSAVAAAQASPAAPGDNPTSIIVTSSAKADSAGGGEQTTETKPSGGRKSAYGGKPSPSMMSEERRDQLVRQGTLVKVRTPMGFMYKYAE